jgi:hypothetical protein
MQRLTSWLHSRAVEAAIAGSAVAALLLAVAFPAAAQEGKEPLTIADDPFEVTDPRSSPPGEAQLAIIGSWGRARGGRVRNTAGLETELALGVAPNLELRIGQVGAYGNLEIRRRADAASRDEAAEDGQAHWGGLTRFGFLYHLASERGALPAAGLIGRMRTVYGPGRPAYETEAIALIGKTVRAWGRPIGLHLNLGWTARLDPPPGERPSRYFLNASVGGAVTPDTALVMTYAREQQERGEHDFSLIQAGIRHRLPDDRTVVGLAAGIGIGRDSPAFQLSFAVQWGLGLGGP